MTHAHLEDTYTIRQNPPKLFIVDLTFKFNRCSVMLLAESGNPTLRSQSHSPGQTPALPLPRLSSLPMQGHEEPQTTSKKTNQPQTCPSAAALVHLHAREAGIPHPHELPGVLLKDPDTGQNQGTKLGCTVLQHFPGLRTYSRAVLVALKTGESSMPEQKHPKQTKNKASADLLSHCRMRGQETEPDNTHREFALEALKVSGADLRAFPEAHS